MVFEMQTITNNILLSKQHSYGLSNRNKSIFKKKKKYKVRRRVGLNIRVFQNNCGMELLTYFYEKHY